MNSSCSFSVLKSAFLTMKINSQSYKWYPRIVHCRCFIIASFVASVVNDVWVVMVQSLDNDPGITETRGEPPAMFFSSHWTIGQKPQRRHCPVQHNPQHHSLWRWYRGGQTSSHCCSLHKWSLSIGVVNSPDSDYLNTGWCPRPLWPGAPAHPGPLPGSWQPPAWATRGSELSSDGQIWEL